MRWRRSRRPLRIPTESNLGFGRGMTDVSGQTTRLLERELEIERLNAALSAARQGNGSAMVVEGDPGVGKSTLLERGHEEAERIGLRVLAARGNELEQDFAFGVARQLFERQARQAVEAGDSKLFAGSAKLAATAL